MTDRITRLQNDPHDGDRRHARGHERQHSNQGSKRKPGQTTHSMTTGASPRDTGTVTGQKTGDQDTPQRQSEARAIGARPRHEPRSKQHSSNKQETPPAPLAPKPGQYFSEDSADSGDPTIPQKKNDDCQTNHAAAHKRNEWGKALISNHYLKTLQRVKHESDPLGKHIGDSAKSTARHFTETEVVAQSKAVRFRRGNAVSPRPTQCSQLKPPCMPNAGAA